MRFLSFDNKTSKPAAATAAISRPFENPRHSRAGGDTSSPSSRDRGRGEPLRRIQFSHGLGRKKPGRSQLQHPHDIRAVERREIVEYLIERHSRREIVEQSLHRHARTAKYASAAEYFWAGGDEVVEIEVACVGHGPFSQPVAYHMAPPTAKRKAPVSFCRPRRLFRK